MKRFEIGQKISRVMENMISHNLFLDRSSRKYILNQTNERKQGNDQCFKSLPMSILI